MWTPEQLDTIARTQEVHVRTRRPDGTYTRGQIIWAVVVNGDVFIRSTDGPEKPWYRSAHARGVGQLRAGGQTFDVSFTDATAQERTPIDTEYRRKYRKSPLYNINRAAGSTATLRLLPLGSDAAGELRGDTNSHF